MMRLDELKDQLRQLNEMIRVGELHGDAARKARDTLEAEVLAAVLRRDAVSAPLAVTARPSRRLIAGLVAFVLVVGGAGYAWLGNREGLLVSPGMQAPVDSSGASHELGAGQIEMMAEQLAGRLKEHPDDARGWSMLGRTYGVLGRFPQAKEAYQHVIDLRPQDAQAYADYADASAMANGGKLEGEPEKMIERALQLDPDNAKALSLAGTLALRRGDAALAASRWERALRGVEPASDMANQIQAALNEARQRSGPASLAASSAPSQAGAADPRTSTSGIATAAGDAAARAPSVKVHVSVSTALRARAAPDDTVFVYARAVQGPKAPLAIQRLRVRDLPLIVTLDDAASMSPALRLSTATEVVIGARISKTGAALAQPGDLQGLSPAVAVGAHDVRVEISDVVK
jgi:cytochrome c-type biogenesis protein CcmH